jgi:rsbT co-antagonist protein RsbR
MLDAQLTKRLSVVLATKQDAIVENWTQSVHGTLRGRLTRAELGRQLGEVYSALQTALDSGTTSVESAGAAELMGLLSELSRNRARQGFSAHETAVSVFALKEAVLACLDMSDLQSLADYAAFSSYIDKLGLHTFEVYANAREAVINEQSTQLLELSTPVVKLWDGIVAVPLIGTLDSARSQVVMERLLQALVDTGSPVAILDITGVPAVDTQVAQHILKTVVAAQLMGAQCIISGIRPQIAQTIVALGIEFGDIVTKANLADALQYALRQVGVDVGRRAAKSAPAS